MTKKSNKSISIDNHTPSEGELFIAEYFKKEKISFQTEVPINGLYNDSKSHRRADFYLPNYKCYVEFYGRWNNTKEDRERYREKKQVFFQNNIPCVYLYPENLGIIDFSFNRRLTDVLKKYTLRKELFRYRLWRFLRHEYENLNGFLFFGLVSLVLFLSDEKEFAFLAGVPAIYFVYKLLLGLYKMFKN